jgi:toxin ParE1/3/4
MPYRLTNKAADDILDIWAEGAALFGEVQAERYHSGLEAVFRFLSENPKAARMRTEIDPPVRAHPFQSHLVVYEVDANDAVLILRVRHGHEDWISDPVQDPE